jgi:putative transposase
VDKSPRVVYYEQLDIHEKILASPATFYRVLAERGLNIKRRYESGRKLKRDKPILIAKDKHQVWCWDVSYIVCNDVGKWYYLYVILDIYSRFVVGWSLEEKESEEHAMSLWKRTLVSEGITGSGLVNHKDNGSIMRSEKMLQFVKATGMIDSYSRAGKSNDNPFSESLFGTIKGYCEYPNSFEDLESAREYFKNYFDNYNFKFRHSGIQYMTPSSRHYGEEEKIVEARNSCIQAFYESNNHRYAKAPKLYKAGDPVTIN